MAARRTHRSRNPMEGVMMMYRNSEPPFATLPFTVRRDMIEHGIWSAPRGWDLPAPWQVERMLCMIPADLLPKHQAAMEQDRARNPHLYR
jgi:hypothetical protein